MPSIATAPTISRAFADGKFLTHAISSQIAALRSAGVLFGCGSGDGFQDSPGEPGGQGGANFFFFGARAGVETSEELLSMTARIAFQLNELIQRGDTTITALRLFPLSAG